MRDPMIAGRDVILAADVGTSSLKAVAFSRDGTPLRQVAIDYVTHAPQPGAREQDPGDWWSALVSAIGALDAGPTAQALVFTGTMQNCVAMGRDGLSLGRAVLYSDAGVERSSREARLARLPPDAAARIGNHPDEAMPVLRLIGEDARLARGPHVHYHFGAKDVLVERLTGRAVIDATTATTTGLFDLERRRWDAELVSVAGLVVSQLPAVLPADVVAGTLRPDMASTLGLPPGLPVVTGAGDAGAATWGAGGNAAGRAHGYLGTTGWVAATSTYAAAAPPRDTYTLAAPVGPTVISIAPLLQAGSALDWVGGLGPPGPPATDDHAVDRSPPSALFLPYLAGERSPFQDRDVRAAFLGLDDRTGPRELRYAALEGLCHAIRDNLDALGLRPEAMPLIGGVAEDPLLRQLLADVLGLPVAVAPHPRLATAYGAFLFALAALGWEPPPPAAEASIQPRAARRGRAERRFRAYRQAQGTARAIAADLLAQPDMPHDPATPEERS